MMGANLNEWTVLLVEMGSTGRFQSTQSINNMQNKKEALQHIFILQSSYSKIYYQSGWQLLKNI